MAGRDNNRSGRPKHRSIMPYRIPENSPVCALGRTAFHYPRGATCQYIDPKTKQVCGRRLSTHNKYHTCLHHPLMDSELP